MELATVIGLVMGIISVFVGMILKGAPLTALNNPAAFLIIIGGTMSCLFIGFRMDQMKKFPTLIKKTFNKNQLQSELELRQTFIDLSAIARKEGLLALEEAASDIEDAFLKKGIMLVVDGTDPELVRGILETDLSCTEDRHKQVIGFWEKWAELGPAWGMIGTLIGLVNMLKNLEDASTIGPNMAVALLTTLYGSLIANWLCNPTATKLKLNNANEMIIKQIIVEGLLSIQAGENPHVIEEKLKTFITPKDRESLGMAGGGEE